MTDVRRARESNRQIFDERVHHGNSAGKGYDEVASEIDEALGKLKAINLPESQP